MTHSLRVSHICDWSCLSCQSCPHKFTSLSRTGMFVINDLVTVYNSDIVLVVCIYSNSFKDDESVWAFAQGGGSSSDGES